MAASSSCRTAASTGDAVAESKKSWQLIAYLALEQLHINAQREPADDTLEVLEMALNPLWDALSSDERKMLKARVGTLAEKNDTQIYIGGELVLGPKTEKA